MINFLNKYGGILIGSIPTSILMIFIFNMGLYQSVFQLVGSVIFSILVAKGVNKILGNDKP